MAWKARRTSVTAEVLNLTPDGRTGKIGFATRCSVQVCESIYLTIVWPRQPSEAFVEDDGRGALACEPPSPIHCNSPAMSRAFTSGRPGPSPGLASTRDPEPEERRP